MNPTLKKILYAEDEKDIREIVKIALEDLGGYEIQYCSNGQEAIEAAKHGDYDLLLLDVMMPGMDGPSTLREIRKIPQYETIPAVFMTAKIQPKELAEYQSMGVVDIITKPFDPMTLADNLKFIWNQREKIL